MKLYSLVEIDLIFCLLLEYSTSIDVVLVKENVRHPATHCVRLASSYWCFKIQLYVGQLLTADIRTCSRTVD
jgi:hypothetical protein